MNTLSVISSSSRCGARPLVASALTIVEVRVSASTCRAEMFTATFMSSGQVAASAQAVRSTQAPSSLISRVSSAIGTKTAGAIGPRSG